MPRPRFFWSFLAIPLGGFCALSYAQNQQTVALQEQQPPTASQPPAQAEYKKGPHAGDTLIRGTVFSDKAMALPGAQLRLRRAGEKKFRWEKFSNSRGEFGVYVPQGSSYEIVVRLKGFADLNQTVEARAGAEEERIVLHMVPAAGGKK